MGNKIILKISMETHSFPPPKNMYSIISNEKNTIDSDAVHDRVVAYLAQLENKKDRNTVGVDTATVEYYQVVSNVRVLN